MAKRFPKVAMCEECGKNPAIAFCWQRQPDKSFACKFCCNCSDGRDYYYVLIDNFFAKPASNVDWLAHLHKKRWFNATQFLETMHRFRAATASFNKMTATK